jgi:hypothetical protein
LVDWWGRFFWGAHWRPPNVLGTKNWCAASTVGQAIFIFPSKEEDMKHILFVLSIAALFLSACGSIGQMFSKQDHSLGESGALENAPSAPPAPADGFAYDSNAQRAVDTVGNPGSDNRLVIQNADLTIVVKEPTAKMQAIEAMAKALGGFVVSSNMGQTYAPNGAKVPEGSIVVRIPAAKLDDALKEIKGDAVDVTSETRSGQDVTKEYTDLQSQLKNLQATEQQLTLIMQKAEKTEDVLAVFTQLTQIRGQIEVIKGQMQYYEQSAALSAVTVHLVAEQTIQPIEIAGWQPQGEARDAVQALVKFFQKFVDSLIWFVLFILPALLLILLPFYLIFLGIRAWVRRNRAKKTVG